MKISYNFSKKLQILISCGLILLAFFLGYLFCYVQVSLKESKEENRQKIVIIDTNSKSVNFSSPEKSVIFLLNGKPTIEGKIELQENE